MPQYIFFYYVTESIKCHLSMAIFGLMQVLTFHLKINGLKMFASLFFLTNLSSNCMFQKKTNYAFQKNFKNYASEC